MNKGGRFIRRLKSGWEHANEEKIFNVPNFFTTLRVIITVVIIYLVFNDSPLPVIAFLFVAGMITDAIDGNVARIWNMKTEFGRKYDMLADRFLFVGTIVSVVIHFSITGYLGRTEIIQIVLIMGREIIGLPAAVWAFYCGNVTPKAKVIGKVTTVLQAVTFPIILLKLEFAWYFVIITALVGISSGIKYITDVDKEAER